jgi:hypothetical protein
MVLERERTLLKRMKVRELEPALRDEVLELAKEMDYERTIKASSNLHFLYVLYQSEKKKRRKSREALKKAENLIMTIATLQHTERAILSEKKGKKKKRRMKRSTTDTQIVVSPKLLKAFRSIGIRDEAVVVRTVELLGEVEAKDRIDEILDKLGSKAAKKTYGANPKLLQEPNRRRFSENLDKFTAQQGTIKRIRVLEGGKGKEEAEEPAERRKGTFRSFIRILKKAFKGMDKMDMDDYVERIRDETGVVANSQADPSLLSKVAEMMLKESRSLEAKARSMREKAHKKLQKGRMKRARYDKIVERAVSLEKQAHLYGKSSNQLAESALSKDFAQWAKGIGLELPKDSCDSMARMAVEAGMDRAAMQRLLKESRASSEPLSTVRDGVVQKLAEKSPERAVAEQEQALSNLAESTRTLWTAAERELGHRLTNREVESIAKTAEEKPAPQRSKAEDMVLEIRRKSLEMVKAQKNLDAFKARAAKAPKPEMAPALQRLAGLSMSSTERAHMTAYLMRADQAKILRALSNIETMGDAAQQRSTQDNLNALLRKAAAEEALPQKMRHVQGFINTASDSELMLIATDMRINPAEIASEHFRLVASEAPVNNPKRFDRLLNEMRAIPNEYHRNMFTGLMALRSFRAMRMVLGPIKGEAPVVKPVEEMGYPPDLLPAAKFLRRFGLDPKVHQEFQWIAKDTMQRSQLFHRVEKFENELTAALNKLFPRKRAQVKALVEEMSEMVNTQDVNDTWLQYTPHGWRHSLDTLDISRAILDASSLLQYSMRKRYGKMTRARMVNDLTALLHDIGYGRIERDDDKSVHPQLSAEIFSSRIAPRLAELLGMDLRKYQFSPSELASLTEKARPQAFSYKGKDIFLDTERMINDNTMLGDIHLAIENHPANHRERDDFTPASDMENPALLEIRASDNAKATLLRMRSIQTEPVMLEILEMMYERGKPIHEALDEGRLPELEQRPGEPKKAYKARKAKYFKDEMADITKEYMVTREMVEAVHRGEMQQKDLPLFAQGRSLDDALRSSELLDRLDEKTYPHFKGCERLTKMSVTEDVGTDGMPLLLFNVEIKGRVDDTPVASDLNVHAATYQLARAVEAFESLAYGRPIPKEPLVEIRPDKKRVLINGMKIRYEEMVEAPKKKGAPKEKKKAAPEEKRGKIIIERRTPKVTFGVSTVPLER